MPQNLQNQNPNLQNQNQIQLPEKEEKEKPKKKMNPIIKFILFLAIFLIIIGICYIIYTVRKGGAETPETPSEKGDYWWWWIPTMISIFILGGIIIFQYQTKKKKIELKQPVPPDRAIELFTEHFCNNHKISCRYDHKKKMFVPLNPEVVKTGDRVPFYNNTTGENFLMIELEVKEGTMQGIHTIIIPIERGEDVIKQGYYRLDTHIPRFQFQLNRVNYPMSSLQDKQDRLKMAMLELSDEERDDEKRKILEQQSPAGLGQEQNIPYSGGYGGYGGGYGGYSGYRYRPRPYYRRRYY